MKQSRPSYRDSYTWKCAECETINGIHRDFCRKCHVGIYESQAKDDSSWLGFSGDKINQADIAMDEAKDRKWEESQHE
jgi:GGDEF domain-containing protein